MCQSRVNQGRQPDSVCVCISWLFRQGRERWANLGRIARSFRWSRPRAPSPSSIAQIEMVHTRSEQVVCAGGFARGTMGGWVRDEERQDRASVVV